MSREPSHDGPEPYDMAGVTAGTERKADEPKKSVGPSQATTLVRLAQARYRILAGLDGSAYAVELDGPAVARPLRGWDGLRQRLARAYHDDHKSAPSGSALTDALAVLEGMAADCDREPVALRLTRYGQGIVIDLGTADGRCIIVEPGTWWIANHSPVLFRRTALTGALPVPVSGGTTDGLAELVNADEASRRLLVGWLVAGLIPDLPHPILAVFGEQGTAKTTLLRLLAALIDPSPAPTRTAPRDIRQWAVTASASWLVCLDNVSTIDDWFSDAMCRAVTGDALTYRALYTDNDVSVIAFRRLLALSSIDAGSLRGDLGDRLLPIELDRIDPAARRRESTIDKAFAAAAPELLGALLDLLAGVLNELPRVSTTTLPRMADFAAVLTALDTVTGWNTVDDYSATAADIAETVIDSDRFACAVRDLVPPGTTWAGTAAELLNKVTPERPPRGWPRSPRAVSGAIRRITPALRTVGITVEHAREPDGNRTRTITITAPTTTEETPPGHEAKQSSLSSSLSLTEAEQQKCRDGKRDGRDGARHSTVPTVQGPSSTEHASDQHGQDHADGWDGRDGPIPLVSRCDLCGSTPSRIDRHGRRRCASCAPHLFVQSDTTPDSRTARTA